MFRFNKTLLHTVRQEWEEAKDNPFFKASFEAYRLNRLVETREEMLCRVEQWQEVEARPVPAREGKPIVGLDLGANKSWSAIVGYLGIMVDQNAMRYAALSRRLQRERSKTQYHKGLYQRLV